METLKGALQEKRGWVGHKERGREVAYKRSRIGRGLMEDVAEEFYIIGKSSVGEGEWGRSGIGRFILAYKVQDIER